MNTLLLISVLVWLSVCAVYDIRFREVPNWLTLPALGLAVLRLIAIDCWLLVVLVVGLISISELPEKYGRRRVALGGLLAASAALFLPSVGAVFQAIVLYAIWAIWELRLTGTADAKLMMALVSLFSASIFFAVVLIGGLQGLWWKLAKKTGGMPYAVSIVIGAAFWLLTRPWW